VPKTSAARSKIPSRKSTKPRATDTAAKTSSADTKPESESVVTDKKTEPSETISKPEVVVTDTTPKREIAVKKEPPPPKANPLANVSLVIVFKDGRKVERPMTEVLRFTADQTTLTVVSTHGRIAKFSILEVASVTIQ
jgi:hypothetical protein